LGQCLALFEQNSEETLIAGTVLSEQLNGQEGDPGGGERFSFVFLRVHHSVNSSGVPNVYDTVFGAGDEVIGLALIGVLFVDFDGARNELNVTHKVSVGAFDIGQDELFQFHGNLLCLVLFFVGHLGHVGLATAGDSVVERFQVPAQQLSVDGTTNDNVRVLRVKFDASDLDRGLQNVVQGDNLDVGEVQDEDVGVERLAHDLAPVVEAEVLDQGQGDEERLVRVELNA